MWCGMERYVENFLFHSRATVICTHTMHAAAVEAEAETEAAAAYVCHNNGRHCVRILYRNGGLSSRIRN